MSETTVPPSAPPSAPPPSNTDPHASKVAAGDRRLHAVRAQGRTLRKGPAVVLLAAVLGILLLAITFALQPASQNKTRPEPSSNPLAQPAVIPDSIRMGQTPPTARPVVVPVRPLPTHPPMERQAPAQRLASINRDLQHRSHLEQDQKAAGASILFDAKADPGSAAPGPAGAPSARTAGAAPATAGGGANAGGAASALGELEADPNRQDRKNAFLDAQGAAKTTDYLVANVQHPHSPFELKAGSIIPAVLVTGINSDLPGPVIGQVRENVYDTVTGNYLLVPQGARLLATYDSMVSWGQERVLMCWNRLLFPNGDSINLQCMPAGDLQGAAGVTDEVNEHWWRLLKGAAIATLLAGTSQGLAGNVSGYNPTVPQMFAQGAGGQINQVGQQLTRRDLQVQPTITVRPGFSVNLMVTKDIVLSPYVGDRGAPGRPLGPRVP